MEREGGVVWILILLPLVPGVFPGALYGRPVISEGAGESGTVYAWSASYARPHPQAQDNQSQEGV